MSGLTPGQGCIPTAARFMYLERVTFAIEICLSLTFLSLSAFEYADNFRKRIWANGGAEGWNSDPGQRIYFYANFREPPEIPLIWTQRITNSNLALAILTFTCVIIRIITTKTAYLPNTLAVLYDAGLLILWINSVIHQNSSDFSDPKHPSAHPWYLRRSCAESWDETRTACHVLQASFTVSILLVCLYWSRIMLWIAQLLKWKAGHNVGYEMVRAREGPDEDFERNDRENSSGIRLHQDALSPVLAFFPEAER